MGKETQEAEASNVTSHKGSSRPPAGGSYSVCADPRKVRVGAGCGPCRFLRWSIALRQAERPSAAQETCTTPVGLRSLPLRVGGANVHSSCGVSSEAGDRSLWFPFTLQGYFNMCCLDFSHATVASTMGTSLKGRFSE